MDDGPAEEIMRATYRALCEHGYADLTMQRIADESSKSKAALHYHFDTKEELLDAFLEYLLERFEERLAGEEGDPDERLSALVEAMFHPPGSEDDGEFPVALLEIKAQAPYHEPYRERLAEMDESMRDVIASAVREGVESGEFAAADPEAVARFVVTATNGAHAREVALGEDPAETRRIVEAYLDRTLERSTEVAA
jgi:AcrR family transcriptional regulator